MPSQNGLPVSGDLPERNNVRPHACGRERFAVGRESDVADGGALLETGEWLSGADVPNFHQAIARGGQSFTVRGKSDVAYFGLMLSDRARFQPSIYVPQFR